MTVLDGLILAAVALAAIGGFRRGFLVGAFSLGGFAAGVLVGTRLGEGLAEGAYTGMHALLVVAAGFIGSALFAGIGMRLRVRWTRRAAPATAGERRGRRSAGETLDRVLGAVLSTVVAFGLAWLAGAAALQPAIPATVREAVRQSLVLTRLSDALPPPDPILAALPRFDSIPQLRGPSADVPAPPRGIARDSDVRAARASVVRVVGVACRRGMSGSGWVADRGMVVTNAHVVAGQEKTQVQVGGDGRLLDAVAVAVDRRNDVAVLRVAGLDAPALRMASNPEAGTAVAMLGFPGNGPYRARPARLGATRSVFTGEQSRQFTPRTITLFRARAQPGNSGGPLVDGSGRVAGTVFAARAEERSRTGFAVPNGPVRRALRNADGPVSTGPCAA